MVLGIALSARVGPLGADRLSRQVADAVAGAPAEVDIRAGAPGPAGISLQLWCPDEAWCRSTANLLGGEHRPGFVHLRVRRQPLSSI